MNDEQIRLLAEVWSEVAQMHSCAARIAITNIEAEKKAREGKDIQADVAVVGFLTDKLDAIAYRLDKLAGQK